MVMDGRIPPTGGMRIRTAQPMPSRQKPCSGKTPMGTVLGMYRWVHFEMIVPKNLEPQFVTCRVVKTTMAMVGRTNTANGMQLLRLWVKTQQHLG